MDTYKTRPADLEGHTVGACLDEDGAPLYFHIPETASEHEVAGMAFEARHGRRPSQTEWEMLALIQRHRGAVGA